MAWLTVPALLGAGARAAGRRLHRHLFLLALDLRHQHADRHPRHRSGHPVHRGRPRAAARPLRRHRPGAVRRRAGRPDVRAGDRRAAASCRRPDRGDDRRRYRRHRRLPAACVAPSGAAAGLLADAAAVLRRGICGDDAVPHRHRRHSVPAADDAAGGLRRFRGAERADHLRQFRRRPGDEAGDAANAAPVRLPRHAGVERRDLRR